MTGRKYEGEELTEKECLEICEQIIAMGTGNVVLTGVQRGDGKIHNCGIEKENGYFDLTIDMLPYHMHGTGDLFTSVVVAALMLSLIHIYPFFLLFYFG